MEEEPQTLDPEVLLWSTESWWQVAVAVTEPITLAIPRFFTEGLQVKMAQLEPVVIAQAAARQREVAHNLRVVMRLLDRVCKVHQVRVV